MVVAGEISRSGSEASGAYEEEASVGVDAGSGCMGEAGVCPSGSGWSCVTTEGEVSGTTETTVGEGAFSEEASGVVNTAGGSALPNDVPAGAACVEAV